MFEIMKILRKDNYASGERISLSRLYPGCTVGFGFMPQNNISGCRMTVKAVGTYSYGDEVFLSHALSDGEKDINLIITRDDAAGETILSLSQRIENQFFSALFEAKEPKTWFAMQEGDALSTSPRVMGMQQSWISPSYKLAAKGRGGFYEGDYRLRKRPLYSMPSRDFEYVIFVDATNEHALEAEKYEDGTLLVYSTVYRPATDIGGITHPERKQKSPARNGEAFGWREKNDWRNKKTADIITMTPKADDVKAKEDVPEKSETVTAAAVVEAKVEETADKIEKTVKAVEIAVKTPEGMLAMDTRLAAGIVSEAQRSKMSISDLIRKVIDLPADIGDKVMVAFSLSETEQEKLARRYALAVSDSEGVKQKIVKELQQFIGDK